MGAFKVYVVLVGLNLVVGDPSNDYKGVTAILADAEGRNDATNNSAPAHSVTLNFRTGASAVTYSDYVQISLEKKCTASCPPNMLLARANQPNLLALSEQANNSVKSDCTNLADRSKCVDSSKKSLLKGHVRLVGDWVARAASACSSDTPSQLLDAVDWKYSRYDAGTRTWVDSTNLPNQVLGNTYVFETKSDFSNVAGDDLTLKINGTQIPLSVANVNACKKLGSSSGACAILEIRNESHLGMAHAAQESPDTHFAILYELLTKAPTYRWVPYATSPFCTSSFTELPVGGGDPPGSRCGGGGGG